MKNRAQSILFSSIAIAGMWMFGPSPAHAELNACGGIFLTGDAACQYRPTQECMTQCMTVAVEQPCVAQVYNECETTCTSSASVECESSCTSSCVNNCTTTTTTDNAPTCMELCLTDCDDGSDDHYCGSSQHKGACGRCEKHNCSKKCEEKCGDAEAPKKITTVTECMPTCTNACSASCTAKANTECQVNCQERTYQQCETKMVEQCKTECKQTGGAIFCDGQFVNATNANSCADELRAKVKIDIDIKASISATGAAVTNATNKIDKACTVANVGAGHGDGLLGALCSLCALALCRLNRRRTRR